MNKLYIIGLLLFILLLFFAPATCNGVTVYTGIRGCSS